MTIEQLITEWAQDEGMSLEEYLALPFEEKAHRMCMNAMGLVEVCLIDYGSGELLKALGYNPQKQEEYQKEQDEVVAAIKEHADIVFTMEKE